MTNLTISESPVLMPSCQVFFQFRIVRKWRSFVHIIFIHTYFHTIRIGTYLIWYWMAYTWKLYVNLNMPYSCHIKLPSLPYVSKSRYGPSSLMICNRQGSNKWIWYIKSKIQYLHVWNLVPNKYVPIFIVRKWLVMRMIMYEVSKRFVRTLLASRRRRLN